MELAIKYLIRNLDLQPDEVCELVSFGRKLPTQETSTCWSPEASRETLLDIRIFGGTGRVEPKRLSRLVRGFFLFCFPFFGSIEESCLYCPRHPQSCRLAMDWEEHSSTGHHNDGLG